MAFARYERLKQREEVRATLLMRRERPPGHNCKLTTVWFGQLVSIPALNLHPLTEFESILSVGWRNPRIALTADEVVQM
jgi:hypothetical protein